MAIIYWMGVFDINSAVFSIIPTEKEEFSWDEYVTQRERRNAISMRLSYEELMESGLTHTDEGRWSQASENFYYAKTIYPDRIEPRRQLCYTYLMRCQDDARYCDKAKKELYFAMKYVHENDYTNKNYLLSLVDLVDIHHILKMDESEALSIIY